ncbi:hypothetical protein N9Y89_01830 [bacterium]|nr:hypothetical protein [bacterium]
MEDFKAQADFKGIEEQVQRIVDVAPALNDWSLIKLLIVGLAFWFLYQKVFANESFLEIKQMLKMETTI